MPLSLKPSEALFKAHTLHILKLRLFQTQHVSDDAVSNCLSHTHPNLFPSTPPLPSHTSPSLPHLPLVLRYGTHLTLRSVDLACWLHSHPHLYPLKYPDGRGSSYQQQVTCYEFKDSNNVWAVRRPGE